MPGMSMPSLKPAGVGMTKLKFLGFLGFLSGFFYSHIPSIPIPHATHVHALPPLVLGL